MRRPLLINASLLVLALVLGALVWLSLERQNHHRNTPLTDLQPERVTLVLLENSNASDMRLERKADGWIMTQPSRAKADDAKIDNLLAITQTRSIRKFQAPKELKEYGLNPPQAVLTLNRTRIEMGGIHPMNQRRYIRIGNSIHLINDRFPHLLQAPADYYSTTQSP